MPLTADSIRLRAPDGVPLTWKYPLPLTVGFWEDTPDGLRTAAEWALEGWNRKVGAKVLRLSWSATSARIWVGARGIEARFGHASYGRAGVGLLTALGDGSDTEFADCELYWDGDHRVIAAEISVHDHLARTDTRAAMSHELGHALLLGHEPKHPWRLMYPTHTGVTRPRPLEARWVREIWGL